MCGRYYLDTLPESLMEYFSISSTPSLAASYNIAPTDSCPIVVSGTGGRRMGYARWGLIPAWAKDLKIGSRMINARSETAAQKPAFREAWSKRHCLVPASGFYEWRRQGGHKQPYLIKPANGDLLAFAGLWERWPDPSGSPLVSFTILTTESNRLIATLHDRMPVIVSPADQAGWLEARGADGRELMAPCSEDLLTYGPVSTEVNSPRNNYPALITPIQEKPAAPRDD